MNKKILYLDMDNVLVDFSSGIGRLSDETKKEYEGRLDDVPGIFGLMEPMPGAVEAVKILSGYFDLYILSTAPWKNISAWSDKAAWVQKYFGDGQDSVFYKRLIISHRKDLNRGDFMVDDRTKNGAGEFEGELIQFGSEQFPNWETVVHYLLPEQEDNINEKIDKKMKLGPGLPDEAAREKARNDALEAQIKGRHIAFPNGKINQKYDISCDFATQLPEISDVKFEGLEPIGLQYNAETKQITGKPTVAGDHKITMQCKYKGWHEGDGRPEYIPKEVTIIINPDPRSLWKNTPTSQDVEYYKLDEAKDFVKVASQKDVPRKDMVAASQRGRSHAHEGKARDDDFALYFDDASEWYVMVVADGAGSAKFSREGSRIACQTAISVCKRELANVGSIFEEQIRLYVTKKEAERKDAYEYLHSIVGKAAFEAYKKISEEATSKQRAPKEYATTLLLSICKKFDFGWFVGAFWVGDGGIGIYRQEPPDLKILGEADGGEFAGQTRFLTMPEIFQDRVRTRFEIVEDFTALILMTDGVTDPKFETDANLNRIEKWHAMWDDLNGKNEDKVKVDFTDDNEQGVDNQLLDWLDFWSKGNHDDRTIAILF